MTGYIVLDTDAASRLQSGQLPQDLKQRVVSMTLCVTFVTVGEFFKGACKRHWGSSRVAKMEEWLRNVLVLPYDAGVARSWGQLMAEAERHGRPVSQNDGWIAACCVSRDLPLMTLNRRHFENMPGLKLIP